MQAYGRCLSDVVMITVGEIWAVSPLFRLSNCAQMRGAGYREQRDDSGVLHKYGVVQ
jgi:hypothetical protein